MNEKIYLKVTSAVVIGGEIQKAGAIVEVDERVAKDLLQRGKAEPASSDDQVSMVDEAEAEAAAKADAEAAEAVAKAEAEAEAKASKKAKAEPTE